LVEIPLLALLFTLEAKRTASGLGIIVGNILVSYHIVSIPVGHAMLNLWNAQPQPVPARRGSDAVLWISIYVFQVLLTTPLMFLLRWLARRKSGNY
jgi:hypothetical protein